MHGMYNFKLQNYSFCTIIDILYKRFHYNNTLLSIFYVYLYIHLHCTLVQLIEYPLCLYIYKCDLRLQIFLKPTCLMTLEKLNNWYLCMNMHVYTQQTQLSKPKQTRGPWATSLTWETFQSKKTTLCLQKQAC